MSVTGAAITLQVRDDDKVSEPFRGFICLGRKSARVSASALWDRTVAAM